MLLAFCCGHHHTLGYRGRCELGAPAGFTVKVGMHFYQEKPCVLMERRLGLGLRREAEVTSSRGMGHTFLFVRCLAIYYLLLLSVKKNEKLEEEGTFHSTP